MNKETEYDLDMKIYRLLQDEPFFALLSRQLNKVVSDKVSTAGIRFNKEDACYELIYNPIFMAGYVPDLPLEGEAQEKWVLMHELYHASLGHCTGRTLPELSRKTANCAMDLAINSLSNMRDDAPEWVLMPGRGEYTYFDGMFEQSADWYGNKMRSENDEGGEGGEGGGGGEGGEGGDPGQFDDHAEFGGSEGDEDSAEKQIADKRLADAVAKAANECDVGDGDGGEAKGWGSVTNRVRQKIKKFANSKSSKLDPKKVLASFIKASVAADKKTSVTKRNRRLPGVKFGRRVAHRANIAISIDQSGSVSDELLAKIFDWLGEFAKFASFTVVPFDHQVFEEKVYVWKKGEKRRKERVLNGGTDFDAPTEFVNKRNFDGHIIVTDMLAPKPKRSNCQRMWITDEYGQNRYYGGHKPLGEKMMIL